jgi:uncharacterized membrane protein YdfJ with MMPL/SSD domain
MDMTRIAVLLGWKPAGNQVRAPPNVAWSGRLGNRAAGLSMDYQVFLVSRIKERYDATEDMTDAVTFGVASTARIITGAALIVAAMFAGFAAET